MVTKRTRTDEVGITQTEEVMIDKTEEVVIEGNEAAEGPKNLIHVLSEGAADARTAALNATQAAGKTARKTVYSGFYYLTYGVVYSTLFVGSLIPSNNAMGEGVHDGVAAARKDFDNRKHGEELSAPADASAVPA